ncbi:MAG: hypothetical protein QXH07_01340 [Thermoplasmata archaeon]
MENNEKKWKIVDINGRVIKEHLTYDKANELAKQYNDEIHEKLRTQNACDIARDKNVVWFNKLVELHRKSRENNEVKKNE